MKNIGVFLEEKDQQIKESMYPVLRLAREQGSALYVFVTGELSEAAQKELSSLAEHSVYFSFPQLTCPHPALTATHLARAIQEFSIDTVLGLSSPRGRALLPRVAALLDAPLVMDCIDVRLAEKQAVTSQYSGKTLATVELNGPVALYGIRPGSLPGSRQDALSSPVMNNEEHRLTVADTEPDTLRVLSVEKNQSEELPLAEAEIILAGGRGIQAKENFSVLFDCAEKMGAAVGASRAAVDNDWISYPHQVGQTGEKVNPTVYIACGISGSVQHFAGMKNAKIIIAVNTDPAAALMQNCDYAMQGDALAVLQELSRLL